MENSHLMILALTDGKAGHETQTKGVVTLLNNGNQYEVQWLKIYKVSKLTKHILKAFLAIVSPKWALGFYLDTVQLQAFQSDNILLVSAGGETLLPNALLKKYFQQQGKATKNVIATSLRGIPACYFDAVFTIDDKYKNQKPFIYYPIAPNKQLTFQLEHRVQQAKQNLDCMEQKVLIILIGADTKTSKIGTSYEWIEWIKYLARNYPNWKILISTSRRTPEDFEKDLQQAFTRNPQIALTLVNHGQQCDIADYIYAADLIICSPESTSMISEALVSEKKVLIPVFKSSVFDKELENYLAKFEQERWLSKVYIDKMADLIGVVEKITPQKHRMNLLDQFKNI
ncbi:mitochondrial fission ELM1 family protein [Acinetobacter towneri]|uniref:ELM1/GtrOC1 family putative glycosyltransferase n=1 Tax=Acinetobacter towneri TaxID=202956 RepID=UPI001AA040DE|nr:ELM1/GtrOC1 family putative glycosyltransferase [Acinetobacter towneri]QTD64836.1 mitochondrial fission ELM1 family protein [Acinetobacter towneri]